MRRSNPSSGRSSPRIPLQAPGRQPELGQARAQFDDAQKAMQQGNWGDFGKSMDALKRLLSGAGTGGSTVRRLNAARVRRSCRRRAAQGDG